MAKKPSDKIEAQAESVLDNPDMQKRLAEGRREQERIRKAEQKTPGVTRDKPK